jgi:hypothetical protein
VGGAIPPPPSLSTNMQIIKEAIIAIGIVALAWITSVAFLCL